MTDALPDRLCVDPSSRYYDEKLLARWRKDVRKRDIATALGLITDSTSA